MMDSSSSLTTESQSTEDSSSDSANTASRSTSSSMSHTDPNPDHSASQKSDLSEMTCTTSDGTDTDNFILIQDTMVMSESETNLTDSSACRVASASSEASTETSSSAGGDVSSSSKISTDDADLSKPDLPDMNRSDWFTHPLFSKYWSHYYQCQSWYQRHLSVYNNLMSRMSRGSCSTRHRRGGAQLTVNPYRHPYNSMNHTPVNLINANLRTNMDNNTNTCSDTGKSSAPSRRRRSMVKCRKRRSRRAKSHRLAAAKRKAAAQHNTEETDDSDEFEMEINDDMIEFFQTSREHRTKRDADRKEDDKDPSVEHISLEQASSGQHRKCTVDAPKERPGARRTQEMKLLYGNGAAMIHGMETALQMTFDRHKDIYQPKPWPNLPLRIVFD